MLSCAPFAVVFVSLYATTQPGLSQTLQSPPKYSATVHLSVSFSKDDTVKSQIRSFLGRELRSLGDVTIVDEDADYAIVAVGLTLEAAGRTTGFALSATFLKSEKAEWATDKWFHDLFGIEKIELGRLEVARALLRHDDLYLDSVLHTGPFSSLQKICQEIIADFDTNILNPARKKWETSHKSAGEK
jgi:hypothetical protein